MRRPAEAPLLAGYAPPAGPVLGFRAHGICSDLLPLPLTLTPCRLGQLVYIDVRAVSRAFADPPGAPLHWRQVRPGRAGAGAGRAGIPVLHYGS